MHSRKFDGLNEAVVIDVETTGLKPEEDRIVSLAAIRVGFPLLLEEKGKTETDYFSVPLINPGKPIPKSASRIHGIRNQDVKGKESFADIAQAARDFIGERAIVGHNVAFDKAFLEAEFRRAGVASLNKNRSYCTMKRLARIQQELGIDATRPKLEDAAKMVGVPGRKGKPHGALEDAAIALRIAKILHLYDTGKIPLEQITGTNPTSFYAAAVAAAVTTGMVAAALYFLHC